MTDGISRRAFFSGAACLVAFGARPGALQQGPTLLPLRTPGIDHLDVIVPNVEQTTRFYMGVFKTTLHAQPFQGGFRYFVLFGDLPASREVGYLAVGDARGRGTYIGHFCTSVADYRRDAAAITTAIAAAAAAQGVPGLSGNGGFGGIFTDPDGIELQFLPAPDTLVTAAVPSALVAGQQGMVVPRRVDHVLLRVADLDRAARFYRILYGNDVQRDPNAPRLWFRIGPTRLGLEAAPAGQKPHIAHFGVRVAPFDRGAVEAGLTQRGARVEQADAEPNVLRFVDPDGLTVELVSD